MKKRIILLFMVFFLAYQACAQSTTEVVLNVENIPPMVMNPNISSPVRLQPSANTTVGCSAMIRDLNGISDVVAMSGIFWSGEKSTEFDADDQTEHYSTNAFNLTPEANTRGSATVFFTVNPTAVSGLWYCKIIAKDATNLTGYNTTNATIYQISCGNDVLDPGEELADCGGICPACFNVTPINASGVGGISVNASGGIGYQSSQESKVIYTASTDLVITSVNRSSLVEGEGVIPASSVIIKRGNFSMPSEGYYELPVEIKIPANAILGHYHGSIGIQTDTGKVFDMPVYLKVQLPNVPPQVREVQVSYPIIISPNSSVEFTCNATVFDANGFDDIEGFDFFVAHKARLTEDVAFVGAEFKKTSENTGYASGRFLIGPNAPMGDWICTITSFDKLNATGKNTTTFEVYSAACVNGVLDSDEELIDCGGLCPACLEGRSIQVDLKGGTEVSAETFVYSRAPQNLNIVNTEITDLVSPDGLIEKNLVQSSPRIFTIEPKTRQQIVVTIDVPDGLDKSEYVGNMTALTDTTVKAELKITGNMLFRGRGYMSLAVSEGCAGMRVNQAILDEYTLEPIEGANITVTLDGKIVEELTTDEEGKTFFIPEKEGTYNLTARKDGYKTESATADIVLCGMTQTCDDGIQNQGEDGVDCGGPCPPCQCLNGIQDAGEEGVDCGGPCTTCHCSDGVYNKDEKGIDCGGKDCPACPEFNLVPTLVIKKPLAATTNDIIVLQVSDDQDRMTQALLTIENPLGAVRKAMTNRSGGYSINVSSQGIWQIKATRAGYLPTSTSIVVIDAMAYTVVGSFLMLLIFVIIALWYLKKQRALTVADAEAIKRLTVEGKFRDYRKVYITSNLMEKMGDAIEPKRVNAIKLNQDEINQAASLAEEYGLPPDTAELLVLCRKIKAKKFITSVEIPYEVRQMTKPLAITTLDEDSR